MLEENFWQDKLKSQKIIKEKKLFEDLINSYNYSVNQIKDLNDLYELACKYPISLTNEQGIMCLYFICIKYNSIT